MALERLELKHKHDIAVLKLNQLMAEKILQGENADFQEFLSQFAQGIVRVVLFLFLMAVELTGMRAAAEEISCWSGV